MRSGLIGAVTLILALGYLTVPAAVSFAAVDEAGGVDEGKSESVRVGKEERRPGDSAEKRVPFEGEVSGSASEETIRALLEEVRRLRSEVDRLRRRVDGDDRDRGDTAEPAREAAARFEGVGDTSVVEGEDAVPSAAEDADPDPGATDVSPAVEAGGAQEGDDESRADEDEPVIRRPWGQRRPPIPGGIYDKPYIARFGRGAFIGGYMDNEFEWDEGGNTFDQHRFIPFIFAEITDRIHVVTEIEFEHGGLVSGDSETDGEIKLEFATMDFTVNEKLNFRGGVILSPLGKFNLLHDSPQRDLTARPIVDRQIIPTTLSEAGFGAFGTFYPSELSVFNYELYLVNGFDADLVAGPDRVRIRGGRGSQKQDNNENKALVGRFGFSPRLGTDFGFSFHTGNWDEQDDRRLTILALDGQATWGPLEVLGELAWSDVETHGLPDFTVDSVDQRGFYLQGNYHFGFGTVPSWPDSVFTGVFRYDRVDFDTNLTGDVEERYTFGLNWRPVEDTVFKSEWQLNYTTPRGEDDQSPREDRFFFSIATYF